MNATRKPRRADGWALRRPDGTLVAATFAPALELARMLASETIPAAVDNQIAAAVYGGSAAYQRALRRLGWQIVRVRLAPYDGGEQ